MKETPVKVRRTFDETFKREAVENWLHSGKSAAVVAEELGLNANLLHNWKKFFAPGAATGGYVNWLGQPVSTGGNDHH